MSEIDTNLCPTCWAITTHHDPFPEWAHVAPCLEHIVDSAYCLGCGGPLDRNLECGKCRYERLVEQADMLRKEEREKR